MSSRSMTSGLLIAAAYLGTLWTLAALADAPVAPGPGSPPAGAIAAPQHQTVPTVVHKKAPPHHPGVTPAKPPPPPPAQ